MANAKKCANPVCTCIASDKSKYCSAHCEGNAGRMEVVCRCGHEECASNVG
jgi:tRNA pseudouridine-54 N-methylase